MTNSCANVSATIMEHLCTHDWHGYSQPGRYGDGEGIETLTIDGENFVINQGDRDCSSSICEAWQQAISHTGYAGSLDAAYYTRNMRSVFVNSGLFEWKPMSFIAQRGDIYLNEVNHTAMCVSAEPDLLAEFSISENGTIDGEVGDQTGNESHIINYYDFPWDGILHYNGKADYSTPSVTPSQEPSTDQIKYQVSIDQNGINWFGEMLGKKDLSGSSDDFAGDMKNSIRYLAIDIDGWYQVRTEKNGWLDKVYAYNINDLENGCAGDGSPILDVLVYSYSDNVVYSSYRNSDGSDSPVLGFTIYRNI